MKIIFILIFSISALTAGDYADGVSLEEMNKIKNQNKYQFVGQILLGNGTNNGTCILINENTLIVNASSLQKIITKPDTTIVNGKKIISEIEVSRSWIDKSEIQISINGNKYSIENLLIHPDFDGKSNPTVDLAMIITKESVNAIYPQISTSAIHEKQTISIIGLSNYGTNIIESGFESDTYSFITINLTTKTNEQTKFEFIPTSEDKGFAVITENENGIIFNGLYQYNRSKGESVFLDLFSLSNWLSSNTVSQITK